MKRLSFPNPSKVTLMPRILNDFEPFARQTWLNHMDMIRHTWQQGEHVAVIGPTGSGKSSLVGPLLGARLSRGGHVIAFLNKAEDETLTREFKGWVRYTRFPRGGVKPQHNKVALWPKTLSTIEETKRNHANQFRKALNWIAAVGNVCVYIDETLYLTDMVGLEHEVSFLHYFARSSGVSVVTSSQRPFRIPRVILSSATHTYVARTRDKDDTKRLAELGGTNVPRLITNLGMLDNRHDFVYSNPQGDIPSFIVNTRK